MTPIAATRLFDEAPDLDAVLGRRVTILGSTGSIGVNTLDVIAHVRKIHGPDALPITALTAGNNVKCLIEQALAMKPELAVIGLPSGTTVPVGSRPRGATPEGMQDMAGSLLEWTSSLDRPYPYRADDGREDPRAPGERVVRGGNYIFDCAFGQIDDPESLDEALKFIPGVVENGLFLGIADAAIIGGPEGVSVIEAHYNENHEAV